MKKLAICLIFTHFFAVMYAQLNDHTITELTTDYQKKRLELVNDALNRIADNMTQPELTVFAATLVEWSTKHEEYYLLNENDNLGKLESLEEFFTVTCGTAPWLKADNRLERQTLNQYNAICEQYQQAKSALDAKQTEETLNMENGIQKKRSIYKTRIIDRVICREFAVWNQKGEYEKTVNYEKRLQERSEWVFDSICQDAIEKYWPTFLHHEFQNYDADNEILPVELSYKDKAGNKLMSVMYNISISPDRAKECKSAISQINKGYIVSMGEYNGYLFPLKFIITLEDDDRIEDDRYRYCPCVAVTEGVKPLIVKFDELKIDNRYLTGIERIASFEKFYTWKDQLSDSIKIYNLKLQQHPCYYYTTERSYSSLLYQGKWQGNTQMRNSDISYFVDDFQSGFRKKYNMINPPQEAYDNFMKDIHIFYEACMDEFDARKEIKTLFPKSYNHYLKSSQMIDKVQGDYFVSYKIYPHSKLNDNQLADIKKLASAESSELKRLYSRICNELVLYNEPAKSEYMKNQQYFTSPEDFIQAYYVSDNYKTELKTRKQHAKDTTNESAHSQLEQRDSAPIKNTENSTLVQSKEDQVSSSTTVKAKQPTANDYYIAYLIKSKHFNDTKDKTILEKSCTKGFYTKLAQMYDAHTLKSKSNGHDTELEIYVK